MRNKMVRAMLAIALVAGMSVPTFGTISSPMMAYAAEQTEGTYDYNIINGVVDFGQGSASISINGNQGQSLAGKSFEISVFLTLKTLQMVNPSIIHSIKNINLHYRQLLQML